MLLEVYKNYEYSIQAGDGDSTDSAATHGDEVYKTNTRAIVTFSAGLTLEIEPDNDKLNLQVKLSDIATYLLWTSQYSVKWSNDLLLDYDQSINSAHGGLLTKMGFVNIIAVNTIDVSIVILPLEEQGKNNGNDISNRKLIPIASLADIHSDDIVMPIIIMNREATEITSSQQINQTFIEKSSDLPRSTSINVNISTIYIF